jgi:hypothetical protein
VTIDPLSILCQSRGGSTSPEKHLDPVCPFRQRHLYLDGADLDGAGGADSGLFPRAIKTVAHLELLLEAEGCLIEERRVAVKASLSLEKLLSVWA